MLTTKTTKQIVAIESECKQFFYANGMRMGDGVKSAVGCPQGVECTAHRKTVHIRTYTYTKLYAVEFMCHMTLASIYSNASTTLSHFSFQLLATPLYSNCNLNFNFNLFCLLYLFISSFYLFVFLCLFFFSLTFCTQFAYSFDFHPHRIRFC